MIETLLRRFEGWGSAPAMVWQNDGYSYGWLRGEVRRMNRLIGNAGMAGCVVTLETDYSPHAAAALLALLEQRCIVIPLAPDLVRNKREEYMDLAGAEWRIVARREKHSDTDGYGADVDDVGDTLSEGLLWSADKLRSVPDEDRCTATLSDAVPGGLVALSVKRFEADGLPPLLTELRQQQVGGLVIFSSGSTGRSKAAVHRADRLLQRFQRQGRPLRTIPFMRFDHIGGFNTLLQSLASGGCLCMIRERSPGEVCRTIERHRVQALPVSPTFMNLLLLSGAYRDFDLSSLEVVSYGSEVMSQALLEAWNRAFPHIRTVQAYGMSELGILPTRSKASGSLLFAVRDGEVQYRVVDGLLEIRTATAMLGYLNAPSPFTEDGWLRTGDAAVLEGEYLRILGRDSEIINVGGRKVYPAEVEGVLEQMEVIEVAVVCGEHSGITGQRVTVTVQTSREMPLAELRRMIWDYCRERLPDYKIPQKIILAKDGLTSPRMKKVRQPLAVSPEQIET
ncbi:fatty acid--CoA ligase family protein [Paenibacillus sp. JJ-223]|uniref:ANL family adenylate-forming protein n=1 Tax=Paenibacillus sp. JJ-223 TaxID=2905647 RepID=UPI001F43EF8C|nr:fatty acid--CoA ligase family protein [Paenibacillus sp. JJ-223]CAH1205163.1 2-succinylbenzoate--CoA ligase [Paenibacillus sp. JJ-223]